MRKNIVKIGFFLIFATFCFTVFNPVQAANELGGGGSSGFEEVTNNQLDAFNPLKIAGEGTITNNDLSTPGGIISQFLFFAFPMAGLILFVMIFWGGFEILSGAASKKSMDAGRQRITAAVIGFLLLFISYWLMRLIEIVFEVHIF